MNYFKYSEHLTETILSLSPDFHQKTAVKVRGEGLTS